jgi:hypothetical protein
MNSNDKVSEYVCPKTGRRYFTTADTSGRHTLVVDPENVHLLQNVTWNVSPVDRDPTKLRARAVSKAPGIRPGRSLHRLVLRLKNPNRYARALDDNLLNATRANLQVVSKSDLAILNRASPANKVVGVRRSSMPKWLRSNKEHRATIRYNGVVLHLGNYRTVEEAGCAFDAAARRLYGKDAVTNRSLGLILEKAALTSAYRKSARHARRKVDEHKGKIALEKLAAFRANPSRGNFMAFATPRSKQPRVVLTSFADAAHHA